MHNVAIIGSGPAGYTAGIYASRASLEPVLFEGLRVGWSTYVNNRCRELPWF